MFLSFGRGSRVITASDAGFQLYDLSGSAPRRLQNETSLGAVSLAAVEEISNTLVACIANHGSHLANRLVVLFDLKSKEKLTEMHFEEPILGLRVNMLRLVVIMEKRTQMFDWGTLKPLPQISTLSPINTRGLGTLSFVSSIGDSSYYAWPHTDPGQVRGDAVVMDVLTGKTIMITAHQTAPIAAIELSPNGNRVATCSTKGTIIKVFAVPAGDLLFSFRRGSKEAVIDSLVFSPTCNFLAVTSNSSTLHIFKCDKNTLSAGGDKSNSDSEMRSFAKIAVKDNVRYAVGISDADDQVYLIAKPPSGTSEALVEMFAIPRGGGESRRIGEPFRLR